MVSSNMSSSKAFTVQLSILLLFADSARAQAFGDANVLLLCGVEINTINDGRPPVEFDFCPLAIAGVAILLVPAFIIAAGVGAGSWTDWSQLGNCPNTTADVGNQVRTRTCTGYFCPGASVDDSQVCPAPPPSSQCLIGGDSCSLSAGIASYSGLTTLPYDKCREECSGTANCAYFTIGTGYGFHGPDSGSFCLMFSSCPPISVDETKSPCKAPGVSCITAPLNCPN